MIDLAAAEARTAEAVDRIDETVGRLQHNPIAGPVIGRLMEARIALADVPALAAEVRAARAEHELVRENVKQWIGKLERAGFRDGVLAVTMRAFLDEHLAVGDA